MKKIGTSFALAFAVSACNMLSGSEELTPAPVEETPGGPAAPGEQQGVADPMGQAPKPPPGMAMVRVIHASSNAPAVDVYVKGSDKPIVTGLAYGQTSSWLAVPPGSYEVELRAAPSKPSDPIAYKTGALAIAEGNMISAVAAGLLGSMDSDAAFRVLALAETFGTVPAGKVLVRAIHAGADAPSVDLDVGNDDPTKPEVKELARYADTGGAGVELPAETPLAIGIAKAGARQTAFTTPKLTSGAQILAIATGLLGKRARDRDGFSILAIGPNGSIGFIKQDPKVYALHASPDAPRVDAYAGTAEIVSNLGFGEISPAIQVAPGAYTLDFFGAAAGSTRPASKPAASASTGTLDAGESYLAIATGFLASFQLLGVKEGFADDANKSQLRAVHASPDAPAVDVGLVNNNQINPVLFSDLQFKSSSDGTGLGASPGHLFVGVTPANQNNTLVKTFTVPAVKGQQAFVVAAGSLAGKGQGFRFLAVNTQTSPWSVTAIYPH